MSDTDAIEANGCGVIVDANIRGTSLLWVKGPSFAPTYGNGVTRCTSCPRSDNSKAKLIAFQGALAAR